MCPSTSGDTYTHTSTCLVDTRPSDNSGAACLQQVEELHVVRVKPVRHGGRARREKRVRDECFWNVPT